MDGRAGGLSSPIIVGLAMPVSGIGQTEKTCQLETSHAEVLVVQELGEGGGATSLADVAIPVAAAIPETAAGWGPVEGILSATSLAVVARGAQEIPPLGRLPDATPACNLSLAKGDDVTRPCNVLVLPPMQAGVAFAAQSGQAGHIRAVDCLTCWGT